MLLKSTKMVHISYSSKFVRGMVLRGVSRRPVNSLGRKSVRSRKGNSYRKIVNVTKNHNFGFIGLIKYIFFNKRIFKLFCNITMPGRVSMQQQTTDKFNLFSYYRMESSLNQTFKVVKSLDFLLYSLVPQTVISNVSLKFNSPRIYARSSGSKAEVVSLSNKSKTAIIRLPSGDEKRFSSFASCSKGRVSLKEKIKITKGDWRRKRLLGRRPVVRGIAMNPIDHPHGGKKKSVRFPRNPWGLAAKIK